MLFLSLILVAFGLVYYYFKKSLTYFDKWGIPYRPGWPFLGNMAEMLVGKRMFAQVYEDIYKEFPDAKYVGLFEFFKTSILVRDPELIKTLSIKNFESFGNRVPFIQASVDPVFGRNLFNLQGEHWKSRRTVLTPTFSSLKLKTMFTLLTDCVEKFMQGVSKRPAESNIGVDIKDLFSKFSNDTMASCFFGFVVDTMKEPDNEFYNRAKHACNLDGYRTLPKLMHFLRIKIIDKETEDFCHNIIKSVITERLDKNIRRQDAIQIMLDALGDEAKKETMDYDHITANTFSFVFAGFDTNSAQLGILAHNLALNPDVQKKLQDEIDQVLKEHNGKITYDIIQAMPYLDATLQESLRIDSIAVQVERVCSKPIELPPAVPGAKPYTIQPGMSIIISPTAIHNDPQYYPEPRKFDPDRFLNKRWNVNNPYFMGYGIGPRSCIGFRFSIIVCKVGLFYFLSKYSFKPNEKTTNPTEYKQDAFNLEYKNGFIVDFVPRE
ncbi:unnamed protein product [Trichogramma brassicae]|uniref:Cytochrome P450 n=1 Tax=Trichogramma brassicae TaxID=86971 RepID=A0A6H5IBC3_9HYME|nr:unnamed protein product [Trichogramma brassicae]